MDFIKQKMKRQKKPKKVFLSTVDPWDDQLASVEPVELAIRRGTSFSSTSSSPSQASSRSPSFRTPSPWYKPGSAPCDCHSPTKQLNSESGALTSPEWPLPWYKPSRTSTDVPLPTPILLKPPPKPRRAKNDTENVVKPDLKESEDSHSDKEDANVEEVHSRNENKIEELKTAPIIEIEGSNAEKVNDYLNGLPGLKHQQSKSVVSIVEDLVYSRFSLHEANHGRRSRPVSRGPPSYTEIMRAGIDEKSFEIPKEMPLVY